VNRQRPTSDPSVGGDAGDDGRTDDRPYNSFVLAGPDGTVHRYPRPAIISGSCRTVDPADTQGSPAPRR